VRRFLSNTTSQILLFGLVVRLAALALVPDANFPDARAFVTAGKELFAGQYMTVDLYMPLYPLWTYLTGGGLTLRLADITLSVATVYVIHQLAMHIFRDEGAALVAGAISAIYPHFVFYAISGLTETAFVFLVCTAYLCLYRARFFWAGMLLVMAILVRPTIDYLAPVLIVLFSLAVHRLSWKSTVFRLFQYSLIYLVLMTPWWMHQYGKYGQFVRLSLGDGYVLISGNNSLNSSGGGVGRDPVNDSVKTDKPADVDLSVLSRFDEIKNPVARNAAMKAAAYEFIAEQPGRFIELAGLKFVRFWRLWPYAPEYERPAIFVVSVLSFGSVLMLTLFFLATASWRQMGAVSPILVFGAFLTAAHMLTIGSIRYRLPLEPFMIVFAAAGIMRLANRWPVAANALRRFA
jgi:4-amino-4-deoxy-L-arabinose transferase-like glycosyltransferase